MTCATPTPATLQQNVELGASASFRPRAFPGIPFPKTRSARTQRSAAASRASLGPHGPPGKSKTLVRRERAHHTLRDCRSANTTRTPSAVSCEGISRSAPLGKLPSRRTASLSSTPLERVRASLSAGGCASRPPSTSSSCAPESAPLLPDERAGCDGPTRVCARGDVGGRLGERSITGLRCGRSAHLAEASLELGTG